MPSDRAAAEPLARLADVLAGAGDGVRPTPRELAELVWLAARMEPVAGAADPAREDPAPRRDVRREPREERDETAPVPAPPPDPAPVAEEPRRAPLHLPSQGTTPPGPYASLLAPAPPMLRHPLGLQRSLRPLKRRTDAPVGHRLDERATADRIARLGAAPGWWLPVLRPARERWLRLNLVYDTGPTMPVWRPLIRELHATLGQSGVFRTVSALRAEPDGGVPGHGAHAPADGRTVTLVISDCMGPQWRRGEAGTRWYGTLRRWGRQMPLAVVQPLPEHLWRDTALPATPGVFSAPFPAAPAAALTFAPYEKHGPHERYGPHEKYGAHDTVSLPVLEAEPRWLANWAGLVASADGARFPGSAAPLSVPLGPDGTEDRTDLARLSAEDLVLRFRATASPEAFRLAGHLAVGRPDLPVMRLVQRAVEPDPRPQHLAEVILSGMLSTVPGLPGSYAFRPGVRDLLLRGLPRSSHGRTAELLSRMGGLIEERTGVAPGEFRAVTPAPSGTGTGTGVDGDAFATVGQDSLRRLYDSAERPGRPLRPTITFLTDDLTGHPETRITLEYAVHELLSRGSLAPHQYEVTVLPNGYRVHTEPGSYLLPVLVATLRWLPVALARLADRPRLRVLLWEHPSAPAQLPEPPLRASSGITVVVSPGLYEEFTASSAAQGPRHFQPLYHGSERDTPPVAWHCGWAASERESEERDLVQGPFITHDLHELGMPTPGRTAVVHTRSDGPLTLLDPARPYGTRPPCPETYYSVDLTPHRDGHTLPLPSSGKGVFTAAVELSWHVDDPVAFVRGGTTGISGLLLDHLRDAAARITRRHPLRRAGAAQRAVNAELRAWPVPGLAVSCSVRLAPEGTPAPVPERAAPARRRLSAVLADAETVLIGFDGPLARLFPAQTAREAALALLSVVAEHRGPEDAPAGRPPAAGGTAGREAFVHPLDVLRVFAHDRLGPVLRARLDELELAAVPDAPTTHRSVALVRALHDCGRRVVVVTDVCAEAVHRYVKPYRLPLAGVHGRRDDLGLLMPHPDCLLRALGSAGGQAGSGVLISSSVAELTAAQQLGLRPVGYAPTAAGRRRLREGGGEITLSSLEPLLEAARGL